MPKIVSDETMENVCKIGRGHECCRYLIVDSEGIKCAKHSNFKGIIDQRVKNKQMVARGDNCEGI